MNAAVDDLIFFFSIMITGNEEEMKKKKKKKQKSKKKKVFVTQASQVVSHLSTSWALSGLSSVSGTGTGAFPLGMNEDKSLVSSFCCFVHCMHIYDPNILCSP